MVSERGGHPWHNSLKMSGAIGDLLSNVSMRNEDVKSPVCSRLFSRVSRVFLGVSVSGCFVFLGVSPVPIDFVVLPAYIFANPAAHTLRGFPVTIGKIVAYGFCAIFCAIGLGIGYGAVTTYESGDTSKALMMLVAALIFGGAGLGALVLVHKGFQSEAEAEAMRVAHPNEPWLWREDWAKRRVKSARKSALWFLWGFGILWNLMCIPLLVFLPGEILDEGNMAALLGLLFPIVGVGILIAAIRMTIQQHKFGTCEFHLDRLPGVLGGDVSGTIIVPRGVPGATMFPVRLSCIRRHTSGSGKSRSTTETVLWDAEQSVANSMPGISDGPQRISVRFRTPIDAQQTETIDANTSILWKLTASADVPGVDFAADFEVPVFKTVNSSAEVTEEQLRSEDVAAQPMVPFTPETSGITVGASPAGGTEYTISPTGRGNGVVGAIIMSLIFGGVTALIVVFAGPGFFALIFGGITVFIIALMVFGMFGESRVTIEDGHVSVNNKLFSFTTGNRVKCSAVKKIGVRGQSTQGKSGTFSLTLTLDNGSTLTPWQSVKEKRTAEWLAEEVRKAMAPWRKE